MKPDIHSFSPLNIVAEAGEVLTITGEISEYLKELFLFQMQIYKIPVQEY